MARLPLGLLASLAVVRLVDEWWTFLPAGALEAIRDDVGLSYAQAGWLLALLPAGGLLGQVFQIAADYVNRRLLSAAGACAYGTCMIVFAVGRDFWVLAVAAFFWGTASDAYVHGCEVTLIESSRDDLDATVGMINAYGAVGDLLGPLTLAGASAIGLSWRWVIGGAGMLMVVLGVSLALQRFPDQAHRDDDDRPSPVAAVRSLLRDRRVVLAGVVAALFSLLDEPLLGFIIAFLEERRGLSATAATLVGAVAVSGGIAGFVATQHLTRRRSRRALLVGAAGVEAIAIALMALVPWVPGQALAGFAEGFAAAVFWALLEAWYLSLHPGLAGTTGAVVSAFAYPTLVFPAVAGAAADRFGIGAALACYAAVAAIVTLLATLVRSPEVDPRNGRTRSA